MALQTRIRCMIMRGGTSKGIYLLENDLPADPAKRERAILKIFGSPDVRQIDGLGGADPLTSKVAIVGPSSLPDADVDYTFGQVEIAGAKVQFDGNCGNISAGVGPFAILMGLVKVQEPVATVRIHNTNTGKILIEEVPMEDGEPAVNGDYAIPGVPGTGAEIKINFSSTIGTKTGKLLPTGNPVDHIAVPGIGTIAMSFVDMGNPLVFVRAGDLGFTGIESPQEIDGNPDSLQKLEAVRASAALKLGFTQSLAEAVPALPMLAFVAPPQDYVDFTTGNPVQKDQVDFVSRLMFMGIMHKTYAGTGSICTAAAAKIPGTVVFEQIENPREKNVLRIGHPAGSMPVNAYARYNGDDIVFENVGNSRTARRIMDGYVYIRED
nr:PrpF domain-containing protein [Desulfitobacterium hafniense]